jgi:sugar/nucleoside kinase (ribokinase family)
LSIGDDLIDGFDVVVLGAANIDTNVYLYGDDIDFTVEANFSENIDYLGGAGGYSARNFAQLGYKTAFIGYVGNDYQGEFIRRELYKDGIDISLMDFDPLGTKRSVNFMYRDGRRKNFYDGRGSMEVRVDVEACTGVLSQTKLAHFSIVNWTRYLIPLVKQYGCIISTDIQDIIDLDDEYRRDYIKASDVVFFSCTNFMDPEEVIAGMRSINSKAILVGGLGSKGCVVNHQGKSQYFEAITLDAPVIDTNGAGDSLAVGFLTSYYFDGYSLEESISRGQINARYTCTLKATTSNFLKKDELDRIFQEL